MAWMKATLLSVDKIVHFKFRKSTCHHNNIVDYEQTVGRVEENENMTSFKGSENGKLKIIPVLVSHMLGASTSNQYVPLNCEPASAPTADFIWPAGLPQL